MEKIIHSVQGELSTAKLGTTLMHEHFSMCDWTMRKYIKGWFDEEEFLKIAIPRTLQIKELGVNTVVDQTPINAGRDVKLLKRIADETGMQIIAVTGLYYNENFWQDMRSPEFIADLFCRDLQEGMEGTSIKASLIKCATDHFGIDHTNFTQIQAAAIAAKKTGAPVYLHTVAPMEQGDVQLAAFMGEGVDPNRIVIGHTETENFDYMENILNHGAYIGIDRFGLEKYFADEKRIDNIVELLNRGWLEKIIISHDIPLFIDWGPYNFADLVKYGELTPGRPNFTHIFKDILPALKARGVSQQEIDTLLIHNPRRYFEA